jgi:gag-polypeptide of LTR copia-type
MQAYIDKKRSLADRLRLIGSAVSDADLQLFILHGLSIKYDPLVVSLTSRSDAVPFNELTWLLLNHEQGLLKHNLAIAANSSPSFPASFNSSTSVVSGMPQACLASPSEDSDLMRQFSAFLASRGKSSDKPYNQQNSDRPSCQLC